MEKAVLIFSIGHSRIIPWIFSAEVPVYQDISKDCQTIMQLLQPFIVSQQVASQEVKKQLYKRHGGDALGIFLHYGILSDNVGPEAAIGLVAVLERARK